MACEEKLLSWTLHHAVILKGNYHAILIFWYCGFQPSYSSNNLCIVKIEWESLGDFYELKHLPYSYFLLTSVAIKLPPFVFY